MNMGLDDCLRRAAAAHRVAMERALAPLDITAAQFAVLQIVAEAPGLSSAEIARIERLTPPTMSVIVANLERKSALVRRPNPTNARIQSLVATESGLDLLRNGRVRVGSLQERVAAAAPAETGPVIEKWLVRVAEIEV